MLRIRTSDVLLQIIFFKDISKIVVFNDVLISITKPISLTYPNQLFGLLEQYNTPKIHILRLSTKFLCVCIRRIMNSKLDSKPVRARLQNNWSSVLVSTSISSTISLMLSPSVQTSVVSNVYLHPHDEKKIMFKTLDFPNYSPSNLRLIGLQDEFVQMDD